MIHDFIYVNKRTCMDCKFKGMLKILRNKGHKLVIVKSSNIKMVATHSQIRNTSKKIENC
jgi:hypothetical protein